MSLQSSIVPNPATRQAYESNGLWINKTLVEAFDEAVKRTPDKLLVVGSGNIRWTYGMVANKVQRLARHLARLGIGRGDVISAQLPNWAEFLPIHLAATRLGAVTNPLLPVYRARELSYILGFAKTQLVFIPSSFRGFDYISLYRQLKDGLPDLKHTVVVGGSCPEDMTPFESLLSDPASDADVAQWPSLDGNDVTVLLFTSGTEANPKGVLHTHNSLMFGNITAPKLLGLSRDEVIWAASPITHATGLEWSVRQAIVLGATMVLQEVWEVEAALDLIERERCTFTTGATPFAARLLDSPTLAKRDLSSFRTFLCGGASIPSALGAAMLERIGCQLIPCWGMSECFAATMCSTADLPIKQWGTDGAAMPGSEVAIFDESRTHLLPAGDVGEIATRGPHVCMGYANDPARTADTFSKDGWLFSNDLGVKDAEGYLSVVGRKKDIINRAGLKVSPAEVEGLLSKHPAVRAVSIVAVPDMQVGEKSCAFVIASGLEMPTLANLVSFLKVQGLATYKLPEYLVLVTELPLTATGKVQKFKLREGWERGEYLSSNPVPQSERQR